MGVWRNGSRIGLKILGLRDVWVRIPLPPLSFKKGGQSMKMKKQLVLGSALLTLTTAACLKLAQWAGKKIKERAEKKD